MAKAEYIPGDIPSTRAMIAKFACSVCLQYVFLKWPSNMYPGESGQRSGDKRFYSDQEMVDQKMAVNSNVSRGGQAGELVERKVGPHI